MRELQQHYKDKPVVIVGVTSPQGRHYGPNGVIDCKGDPQKEFSLMPEFMQQKQMTWDVLFSKQNVFNPAYGVNGIPHVAIIDAKGNVRHNGLHPASPLADKIKLIDALLAEMEPKK